ncbi:hypothetical protein GBAR_LOCUS19362, partial [Geodia barretti]
QFLSTSSSTGAGIRRTAESDCASDRRQHRNSQLLRQVRAGYNKTTLKEGRVCEYVFVFTTPEFSALQVPSVLRNKRTCARQPAPLQLFLQTTLPKREQKCIEELRRRRPQL